MSTVSPGSPPASSNNEITTPQPPQQQQQPEQQEQLQADQSHGDVSVHDLLDLEMPDASSLIGVDLDIDALRLEGLTDLRPPSPPSTLPPATTAISNTTTEATTTTSNQDVLMTDLPASTLAEIDATISASLSDTPTAPATSADDIVASLTSSSMLLDIIPATATNSDLSASLLSQSTQSFDHPQLTSATMKSAEEISTTAAPAATTEATTAATTTTAEDTPVSTSAANQLSHDISTQLAHSLSLEGNVTDLAGMQDHELDSLVNDLPRINAQAEKSLKDLRDAKEFKDLKDFTLPDIDKNLIDQSLIDSLALPSLDGLDILKGKGKDLIDSLPFDIILPESLQLLTSKSANGASSSRFGSGAPLDAASLSAPSEFSDADLKRLEDSLISASTRGNQNAASTSTSLPDLPDDLTQFTNFDTSHIFPAPKSQALRAQSEKLESSSDTKPPSFHAASAPHSPSALISSIPNFSFSISELNSLELPEKDSQQQEQLQISGSDSNVYVEQSVQPEEQPALPSEHTQSPEKSAPTETTESSTAPSRMSNQTSPIKAPISLPDSMPNFRQLTQSPLPFPRSKSDKSSTLQAINALSNTEDSQYPNQSHEIDDVPRVSAYARLDFPSFTFYVQTLQVILGRGAESAGRSMVDVDLGSAKAISRRHAKIFYNFGTQRFELSVLGRNGAFVDDKFIETGATVPLRDGYV